LRKSPIRHRVRAYQKRRGTRVASYMRGKGESIQKRFQVRRRLVPNLPSERENAIRVKGGYIYINPNTGEVVGGKPLQIERTTLRTGIAGYSKDGLKIWVDKEVPSNYVAPIVAHEAIESVLVIDYGYSYKRAHQIATMYERRFVIMHKGNWDEYTNFMNALTKKIYERKDAADPKDMYSASTYKREPRVIVKGAYV